MKNLCSPLRGSIYSLVLFVVIFSIYSFNANRRIENCDTDQLMENCASELDDFVFIKSFDIVTSNSENKVEYSYVLSRDATYRIVICEMDATEKTMVVNLFDRSHKLIASNQIKASKKIFPILTYQCAATGVYYLEAHFEQKNGGCGLNIIGFKK